MGLNYTSLDNEVRAFMLEEYALDTNSGKLYESENLTSEGKAAYPGILKQVFAESDDSTLAVQVQPLLNSHEKPRLNKGKVIVPKMRSNAHTLLAEGEFNRFYMRGVCRKTLAKGGTQVTVYRARFSENPRPESEAKIGMKVDAAALLDDLRTHIGIEPFLGLPTPNSGLSVRLSD